MFKSYSFSLIPIISGISFTFLTKSFEIAPFLNLNLLRKIGKVSYSMYILHFLFAQRIAQFLNDKLNIENIFGGNATLIIFFLASVYFTFCIAKISERFVENRFIMFGKNIILKMK